MSFLQGIYQLIIGPIDLLIEFIYGISFHVLRDYGMAIIPLSLAINFLLLPFYMRADAIQAEDRKIQGRMKYVLSHIRKTFTGDERYMISQTYYRINKYKPYYSLRSSLSLFLQIPFFISAYRFLSGFSELNGTSFGPFSNLGVPDQLLQIAGIHINILPVLMTAINILSSAMYSRNMPAKDKIQLYGTACLFLILLYNSPSGLVLYWTLNNLFSLVKTIVLKKKNRKNAAAAAVGILGLLIFIYAIFVYDIPGFYQFIIAGLGLLLIVPMVVHFLRKGKLPERKTTIGVVKPKSFITGCLFMTVLTGALIPSSVINSSPSEFINIMDYHPPLTLVLSAVLLAIGTFIIWFGILFYLSDNPTRKILQIAIWIISGISVVNYMFFGTNLGLLTTQLQYEQSPHFSTMQLLINIEVLLAVGTVMLIIWMKKQSLLRYAYPIMIAAVIGMSVSNMVSISKASADIGTIIQRSTSDTQASFKLSRKGKNVVVIMMDRAVNSYLPYLLNERQDLQDQFDGFIWYPNTLSYGNSTNTGSAALYGGYEYTPERMNERDNIPLEEKQNEALRVMPILFHENGYEVTVFDPPYAGYSTIPDLSIYDDYPDIRAFNVNNGQIPFYFGGSPDTKQKLWRRNFFCYSMMKISPLLLQGGIYQDGTYFDPDIFSSTMYHKQVITSNLTAIGLREEFIHTYAALCALSDMTRISSTDENTFLMISNTATHDTMMLQEPEYEPEKAIDNTEYESHNKDRFTIDGKSAVVETKNQLIHYQDNMAAMIKLGEWFDYLRRMEVWDNTRVIIVADHGMALGSFSDMQFGNDQSEDVMFYNPLLMVKDFNSNGFVRDDTFMTNADTPSLAFRGLVDSPENPSTGNEISDEDKYNEVQTVFYTDLWNTDSNSGNRFLPGKWYSVKNQNIFDMGNWEYLGKW